MSLSGKAKTFYELGKEWMGTRVDDTVNEDKWVRLEDHQQEINAYAIRLDSLQFCLDKCTKSFERLERARGLQKQKLRSVLEDMQKIPERRLPLGKIGWLQEWSDVIVALGRLLE